MSDTNPDEKPDEAVLWQPDPPASALLAWWFPWFSGMSAEAAESNAIFWLLVRRAGHRRTSPTRMMRHDTWFRYDGGFWGLLGGANESGLTMAEALRGCLASAAVSRRRLRRHYGGSLSEVVFGDFFGPFIIFLGVGLVAVLMLGEFGEPVRHAMRKVASARSPQDSGDGARFYSQREVGANLIALAVLGASIFFMLGFLIAEGTAWTVLRRVFHAAKPRYGSADYWSDFLVQPLTIAIGLLVLIALKLPLHQPIFRVGLSWFALFDEGIAALLAEEDRWTLTHLTAQYSAVLAVLTSFFLVLWLARWYLFRRLAARLACDLEEDRAAPPPAPKATML